MKHAAAIVMLLALLVWMVPRLLPDWLEDWDRARFLFAMPWVAVVAAILFVGMHIAEAVRGRGPRPPPTRSPRDLPASQRYGRRR
jgi:hypothetical protein